jgi:hypothetical protein
MTTEFFFRLIIGHLIGDYFLQNDWMALNKKEKGFRCFIHCFVYTLAIYISTIPELSMLGTSQKWIITSLILMTHFMLDGTAVIENWFYFINGRNWSKAMADYDESKDIYSVAYICYTAIVHTVADNTIHIVTLYLIFKYLVMLV